MSKKSKSKINIILYAVAIILAVVAVCMIFVDVSAIAKNGDTGYVLTGIQATFGYSEETKLAGTLVYTEFSFMNLLVYILLIVGVVLALLRLFKVAKSGVVDWVAIAAFAAAAVLYFIMPSFVVYGKTWSGLVETAIELGSAKTLMVGAIVGGVTSALAAVSLLANKFMAKK